MSVAAKDKLRGGGRAYPLLQVEVERQVDVDVDVAVVVVAMGQQSLYGHRIPHIDCIQEDRS